MLREFAARIFVLCFVLVYGVIVIALLQWTARTWLGSRLKPSKADEPERGPQADAEIAGCRNPLEPVERAFPAASGAGEPSSLRSQAIGRVGRLGMRSL
jgi:hypothetical protein